VCSCVINVIPLYNQYILYCLFYCIHRSIVAILCVVIDAVTIIIDVMSIIIEAIPPATSIIIDAVPIIIDRCISHISFNSFIEVN